MEPSPYKRPVKDEKWVDSPSPSLQSSGGIGGQPTIRRSDVELIRRAIRWGMRPEDREVILRKMLATFDRAKSGRLVASLARVFTLIEGQNQADDHLAEKYGRMDAGKPTEALSHAIDPAGLEKLSDTELALLEELRGKMRGGGQK